MTIDFDDIAAFRQAAAQQAAAFPRALPHLPTGTYETVDMPSGAPEKQVLLYRPADAAEPPGVFVNLHGGGFVLGGPQDDDPYCRLLADTAGCAVVNLDYALAPERRFPHAVEQTYALLAWLAEHGAQIGLDGTRLAVGGHSAGGNISSAACLLAKQRGGPPLRGQVLDYPPMDLLTPPGDKVPVGIEGTSPDAAFQAETGARFNAWYLPTPADGANPLASPVLAPDLTAVPPALVITAELDTLRAEADRYAQRLAAAGIETEHVTYPGCVHGFTHVGPDQQAADAWGRIADFLRRVLA